MCVYIPTFDRQNAPIDPSGHPNHHHLNKYTITQMNRNKLGFTTAQGEGGGEGRSSRYCTEVGKLLQVKKRTDACLYRHGLLR